MSSNVEKAAEIINDQLAGDTTAKGTIAFRQFFGKNVAQALADAGLIPGDDAEAVAQSGDLMSEDRLAELQQYAVFDGSHESEVVIELFDEVRKMRAMFINAETGVNDA
jgi:hypothetical protein